LKRRAFSLIEVTLVVLILAITAGAVALGVRSPIHRLGLDQCVDEIVAFDRLTRVYAREQDRPVRLMVDLDGGQFRRTDERAVEELGQALVLPSGYRVARLLLLDRTIGSGGVALSYSALGLAPTYAILVEGPGGRRRWMLVAGLTGQVRECGDEEEVSNILAAVDARHHAG
jgi:prepilin-type N-terminal cleavage/methylation domain-containing protein